MSFRYYKEIVINPVPYHYKFKIIMIIIITFLVAIMNISQQLFQKYVQATCQQLISYGGYNILRLPA